MPSLLFLPLSLLFGLILGLSAHRAGLCTVKAVAKVMTSRRGWFLWSFLKAALWMAGLIGLYGLIGGGIAMRHSPLGWITLLGGLIFGLGAGANGACASDASGRRAWRHAVHLGRMGSSGSPQCIWCSPICIARRIWPISCPLGCFGSWSPGWSGRGRGSCGD
jgi:hypothetical protein